MAFQFNISVQHRPISETLQFTMLGAESADASDGVPTGPVPVGGHLYIYMRMSCGKRLLLVAVAQAVPLGPGCLPGSCAG